MSDPAQPQDFEDQPWFKEAARRFGCRPKLFEFVDTPYLMWTELRDAFFEAYKPPTDEVTIRNIYEFAEWCCNQPRGETAKDDLLTCVAVCFYEHIPQSEQAMKDMPRWFTLDEVRTMEQIFSYQVGEEGLRKILHCYASGRRSRRKKH